MGESRIVPLRIVGVDAISNIAVCEFVDYVSPCDTVTLKFANSRDVKDGSLCWTMGYAFNYPVKMVSVGSVRDSKYIDVNAEYMNEMLAADLATTNGTTGSPIMSSTGCMIALLTLASTDPGVGDTSAQGFVYGLASYAMCPIVRRLVQGKQSDRIRVPIGSGTVEFHSYRKPWLGIGFTGMTAEKLHKLRYNTMTEVNVGGILVTYKRKDSVFDNVVKGDKIKTGDIITEIQDISSECYPGCECDHVFNRVGAVSGQFPLGSLLWNLDPKDSPIVKFKFLRKNFRGELEEKISQVVLNKSYPQPEKYPTSSFIINTDGTLSDVGAGYVSPDIELKSLFIPYSADRSSKIWTEYPFLSELSTIVKHEYKNPNPAANGSEFSKFFATFPDKFVFYYMPFDLMSKTDRMIQHLFDDPEDFFYNQSSAPKQIYTNARIINGRSQERIFFGTDNDLTNLSRAFRKIDPSESTPDTFPYPVFKDNQPFKINKIESACRNGNDLLISGAFNEPIVPGNRTIIKLGDGESVNKSIPTPLVARSDLGSSNTDSDMPELRDSVIRAIKNYRKDTDSWNGDGYKMEGLEYLRNSEGVGSDKLLLGIREIHNEGNVEYVKYIIVYEIIDNVIDVVTGPVRFYDLTPSIDQRLKELEDMSTDPEFEWVDHRNYAISELQIAREPLSDTPPCLFFALSNESADPDAMSVTRLGYVDLCTPDGNLVTRIEDAEIHVYDLLFDEKVEGFEFTFFNTKNNFQILCTTDVDRRAVEKENIPDEVKDNTYARILMLCSVNKTIH